MSILREIDTVRNRAGLWSREDYTILQCSGADALTWLHAQTSNELLGLESGQGNLNTLLDRQGRIQAVFSVHRFEDEAWIVAARSQVPAIEARLETHLFLEEVEVHPVGDDTAQLCLEGPAALLFLTHCLDDTGAVATLPQDSYAFAPLMVLGHEVLVFQMTESGEDGFLLVPAPGESDALFAKLREHAPEQGVALPGPAARSTLRMESGLPEAGLDYDEKVMIAETPLAQVAVSYSKGCYLGQEVVARIKAYGTPKQALMGLVITDELEIPDGSVPLLVAGKKAGRMTRHGYSPTLGSWVGLAYLDREYRNPDAGYSFEAEGGDAAFAAKVVALPFYTVPTRAAQAQLRYDEALTRFEADVEDEDSTAITLLEETLLLAPEFEDAYETLGVILHRHGRTDEAIGVMQRLADLNPACVMAHSNLSVFYVAKGMITEAESEKAMAGQLEMKSKLDKNEAAKEAVAERERIQAEARERIAMFLEVLDIDDVDPVATMGLGAAYMQLESYAEAVPYFEKATTVKKDFSVAYLNLGKCHEFLGEIDAAIAAYGAGIAAAGRKGDLMPLREMERRLEALRTV